MHTRHGTQKRALTSHTSIPCSIQIFDYLLLAFIHPAIAMTTNCNGLRLLPIDRCSLSQPLSLSKSKRNRPVSVSVPYGVIDYTQIDFTNSGERYDILLDCVGNRPLSACRRVLNLQGILVLVGAPDRAASIVTRTIGALVWSRLGARKMVFFIARINKEDLTPVG